MKSFIAIKTRARGCLVRIHDLILLFSSHFIFFCLFFLLIRLSDEYFRFMLEAVLLNEGKVSPEEAGPRPDRGICGRISCMAAAPPQIELAGVQVSLLGSLQ